MPVMDGIEATKVIRSGSQFQNLPIIAMTAAAMAVDREACLKAGMNDHIAKPIDPDQLLGALLRWIKRPDNDGALRQGRSKTSETIEASNPVDGPLEISGIDVASALKRTGGNRKRYETLLRRFAQQQAHSVEDIRGLLSSRDLATAERMAHSLKGAASTLGAMAVSEGAAKAEVAIRNGKDVDAILISLSEDLSGSVRAIQAALAEERPAKGGVATVDPTRALEALKRLRDLLENDDGEAADFVVEALPACSGVLTDLEIENLGELVGDFDFEAALACLSRITSRLGVNPEANDLGT